LTFINHAVKGDKKRQLKSKVENKCVTLKALQYRHFTGTCSLREWS